MNKKYQKLIISIMVASLVMVAAANTLAGVSTCLQKACCCTKAIAHQTLHAHQDKMLVHCLPEKPAACCQIEQNQQQTHLAVSSVPEITPPRSLTALVTMDLPVGKHQDTPAIRRIQNDGRPKAPLVPIYLQTQSILC